MNISTSTTIPFVKVQDTVFSATDSAQRKTLQIGQILLKMGKINRRDTEKIHRLQKKHGGLFGDAAKQLNLVSDRDVQHALAYQFNHSTLLPKQEHTMPELLITHQSNSALAESMRAIRTQLILRGFPSDQKTLAVVGINRNSGTSLFTANLAVLFSQLEKQTLLIDANLRNPSQHNLFNLTNKCGLSDVLADRVAIVGALTTVEALPNLSLLPAGTLPPNPLELLSMPKFSITNELFSDQFDIVLYDTPGFMEGTDALMIAKHADYVLLLVHKNQSRLADVEAVSKQITNNDIKIIGSILVDY